MWPGRLILLILVLSATAAACAQPSEFDPYTTYPLAQEAQTLAAGDLNDDRRDDIVVAAWPTGLYVFYQQHDGTLGNPEPLYAPDMPLGIAIGDINGDGRNDLAVGDAYGVVFIYLQSLDGTLQLPAPYMAYGHINSLAINDLNGDGLGDIVGTAAYYGLVFIGFSSRGNGFSPPMFYMLQGNNARCASVLDYNTDGLKDIAVLLDDQVCYLTQGSPGAFEVIDYWPAVWAHSLAAGDVTGDGLNDLVFSIATNQPDAAVGVLAQCESGYTVGVETYPTLDFAQPLAVVDVDGDGRQDVVSAHSGYEMLAVMHQTQDGKLGEYETYSIPYCNWYNYGSIATGDFNSDGLPDIALADWWNGLVVLNHAKQACTAPPVCSASVSGVPGENGWYVSAVGVHLSVECEGAAAVYYSTDGSTWNAYDQPIGLYNDGLYQLGYYAEDALGNRSEVQWLTVGIDRAAPVLTLTPTVTEIWPPTGELIQVPVTVDSSDAVSGINSLHLSVIDEYGDLSSELYVTNGIVSIPLIASRNDGDQDGRVYTLVLAGVDATGNRAEVTSTITVPRSNPRSSGKPDKPGKKPK